MSAQHRILVSGASGDVAQGVLKALQRCPLDLELHTTCVFADSAFLHREFHAYLAPYSASEQYIPFLIDLIRKQKIDLFLPTVDSEMMMVAQARPELEAATGVRVCVGSPEQIAVCQDKLATAEFLRREGFSYPRTLSADDPGAPNFLQELGYPVVVKPRQGRGSAQVALLSEGGAAAPYLGDPRFCFQEWLPEAEGEYTTGIYLGDDGEVKGIATLRRELRHGSTFKAFRVLEPALEAPLADMARRLGLKYLNVQARRVGDRLVPFEFNGRFSGTTGILARVFNAPEMVVREWLRGERLEPQNSQEEFMALRYYEEVYTTPGALEALKERSRGFGPDRPV
jgi:carbamoyl-phosphate synthase large subunit